MSTEEYYKGYVIALGIQMPSYDIYEYEIFEDRVQFEQHNPVHTSESHAEATQWIDRQVELGESKEEVTSPEGYYWALMDLETEEIMIKDRAYPTVWRARAAAKAFVSGRTKYAGEHTYRLTIHDRAVDIDDLEGGKISEEKIGAQQSNPAGEELSVTVTEADFKEAAYEGVWHPVCPYCGAKTPAEPDAQTICCQTCSRHFRIINPYF